MIDDYLKDNLNKIFKEENEREEIYVEALKLLKEENSNLRNRLEEKDEEIKKLKDLNKTVSKNSITGLKNALTDYENLFSTTYNLYMIKELENLKIFCENNKHRINNSYLLYGIGLNCKYTEDQKITLYDYIDHRIESLKENK